MNILRRLLFIPFSAVAAVTIGFRFSAVFSEGYYSKHHIFYSIVGLAPSFFGRCLPVAAFVVLGTVIAPRPGKMTVSCLGLLGGVFGWPFGPIYEEFLVMPTFYLVEGVGAITGAALGMLIGFAVARRKKRPNQPLQPTPMSVTPPADAGAAPATGVADL